MWKEGASCLFAKLIFMTTAGCSLKYDVRISEAAVCYWLHAETQENVLLQSHSWLFCRPLTLIALKKGTEWRKYNWKGCRKYYLRRYYLFLYLLLLCINGSLMRVFLACCGVATITLYFPAPCWCSSVFQHFCFCRIAKNNWWAYYFFIFYSSY